MSDVISPSTSLLDAINIGLGCLGETPVTSPDNTSTNVVLSKQIIEEVSRDVQSKGWWFNTSGTDITLYSNTGSGASEDFNASIPEEARRYIAIRAGRVLQSRFVGSEELQKFSYNEELVSLAILTQANVRNGGNSTSFTSFPSELKEMGIEEIMFLQQSAEEKVLSLRLVTELKTAEKTAAEKDLVDAQKSNVQTDTVIKSQQALTELQNTRKLELETDVSAAAEKSFYDGVVAGTQNTYRDFAAEMRMMGIQEVVFQQTPAYKKIELLSDAAKLRTATATDTSVDATEIAEVNKIMRLIGEPPVATLSSHSLASETVRLLRDTNTEMQGRGWFFNTEDEVELTADGSGRIAVPTGALSVEVDDYSTRIKNVSGVKYLYDLEEKSYTSWSGTEKATVIYQRDLNDVPEKYLEYLEVRVAILLTELYPQSGVDIQRLPKMEAELRAYFKDREFDEANYSVFDSYDTAIRVGINRNYNIS